MTGQGDSWGTACIDDPAGEFILKLVNPSGKAVKSAIVLADAHLHGMATVTTLAGVGPGIINSMSAPAEIAHKTTKMIVKGTKMRLNLTAFAPVVVRVKK